MPFQHHRWLRNSLLNLLIVSAIGVVLRYKIVYSLPFIDQKHLLHGHSHFAFSGWITQAIMILMVGRLSKDLENAFLKYKWLLTANLVAAYGMLITFPLEGYGLFSISFSTLSIFISYIFGYRYWTDLNRLQHSGPGDKWFKTAIACSIFSSLGTFALSVMMAAKIIHQNWYLASVYFYLHFQYNGWFFFACMGLAISAFFSLQPIKKLNRIHLLFSLAVVPAYFLSALWMNIPVWMYVLVIAAAIAQVAAWILMIGMIRRNWQSLKNILSSSGKWLLLLSSFALSIKLLLQLGSTIPALSNLAFGFRPIVIGYLHLVLLGVITIFLLGYMLSNRLIHHSRLRTTGIACFAAGIVINEILLMIQGVSALSYTNVPFINEALLGAAFLMFVSLLLVNLDRKPANMIQRTI